MWISTLELLILTHRALACKAQYTTFYAAGCFFHIRAVNDSSSETHPSQISLSALAFANISDGGDPADTRTVSRAISCSYLYTIFIFVFQMIAVQKFGSDF